jgi:hypothetical protein
MEVFNNPDLWASKDTFGVLRDVIEACLTPVKFQPFKNDIPGLRDAFEKFIVNPLHDRYKSAWEDPEVSIPRAVKLDQTGSPATEVVSENTPPVSPSPVHSLLHAPVATLSHQMPYHPYPSYLGGQGYPQFPYQPMQ